MKTKKFTENCWNYIILKMLVPNWRADYFFMFSSEVFCPKSCVYKWNYTIYFKLAVLIGTVLHKSGIILIQKRWNLYGNFHFSLQADHARSWHFQSASNGIKNKLWFILNQNAFFNNYQLSATLANLRSLRQWLPVIWLQLGTNLSWLC